MPVNYISKFELFLNYERHVFDATLSQAKEEFFKHVDDYLEKYPQFDSTIELMLFRMLPPYGDGREGVAVFKVA